jgi:hypothetical protein
MLFCIEYHYSESDGRHSGAHWYRVAFSVDGRCKFTGVLIAQQEVEQRDENGTSVNRDQKRQTSDSIKKERTALPLVV